VATSVLELGIDVGDLDRVIQIDAPPTACSFLQRMGRSGRRTGTQRNCLLLATRDASLVQAAGLLALWAEGYVEPIVPPAQPYHILAQQLMALCPQETGIGEREWLAWIRGVRGFAELPPERIEEVVQWMLAHEILWEEAGILAMGREGESTYGRRNFLELFSVFCSPPMFSVRHGRQELGYVDEMTFLQKQDGPRVLLLGGRAWQVNHVEWRRRIAYVEATEALGRSRWKGEGRGLGYRLCQAMKTVLTRAEVPECWSQRARDRLAEIRAEFSWLDADSTVVLLGSEGELQWWTFGGTRVNAALSRALEELTHALTDNDSLAVTVQSPITSTSLEQAIIELRQRDPAELHPGVENEAVEGLKFAECLPRGLAVQMLECRMADVTALGNVLTRTPRFVMGRKCHRSM
jgi:ATP-dependent Lhr-like helicase